MSMPVWFLKVRMQQNCLPFVLFHHQELRTRQPYHARLYLWVLQEAVRRPELLVVGAMIACAIHIKW